MIVINWCFFRKIIVFYCGGGDDILKFLLYLLLFIFYIYNVSIYFILVKYIEGIYIKEKNCGMFLI